MVKLATFTSVLAIATGLWTILTAAYSFPTTWNPVVFALAVFLVLGSIVSLVGPKSVFYMSALLSAAEATIIFLGSNLTNFFTLVSVGLLAVTFVLCILAARWEVKVSEQSHPMNLPVFG